MAGDRLFPTRGLAGDQAGGRAEDARETGGRSQEVRIGAKKATTEKVLQTISPKPDKPRPCLKSRSYWPLTWGASGFSGRPWGRPAGVLGPSSRGLG